MPPPKRGAGRVPGRKTCREARLDFRPPPPAASWRAVLVADSCGRPATMQRFPILAAPCSGAVAPHIERGLVATPGGHAPCQAVAPLHARQSLRFVPVMESCSPTPCAAGSSVGYGRAQKQVFGGTRGPRKRRACACCRGVCLAASGGPSLPGWLEIKRCEVFGKRLEKKARLLSQP